ncbi:MAG: DUF4160 domain-containing protein [Desulfobacterales bacterium]|nr:DUF4160 domain-containing protein [Desulfobacterales bacterium]
MTPEISRFRGIRVCIFWLETPEKTRHVAHLHIEYGEYRAQVSLSDWEILDGQMPSKQLKVFQAWAEMHRKEIEMDVKLAMDGKPVFRIAPLV